MKHLLKHLWNYLQQPKAMEKISLLELIESLMLHRMKMGVYFWAVTQREI